MMRHCVYLNLNNLNKHISNEVTDKKIILLCRYLSFSFEGPSWLHGSAFSPQSLLSHQAVEGKKGIHWEVIPHRKTVPWLYLLRWPCAYTQQHWVVTLPNMPSHSWRDVVLIHKLSPWLERLYSLQSGAFKSNSSRIITWVWSTILSRSSSSSIEASCSAVSFPERSSGLVWELEPLGMTGTWQATWTDGPTENTGSEAITGSVSICTRQTHAIWAKAYTDRKTQLDIYSITLRLHRLWRYCWFIFKRFK